MSIIALIITIAKALPVLNEWLHKFVELYIQAQIDSLKKETRQAIKKAIEEQDQRELEKVMGSSKAGLPSGIEGVQIVDHLPGVK